MNEEFVLTVCAPIDENNYRGVSFCSGFGLKIGRFDSTKNHNEQSYRTKDISAPNLFMLCRKHREENAELRFTPDLPYGNFNILQEKDFIMISIMKEGLTIYTLSVDAVSEISKITYDQLENSVGKTKTKDVNDIVREVSNKISDILFEKLPAKEV